MPVPSVASHWSWSAPPVSGTSASRRCSEPATAPTGARPASRGASSSAVRRCSAATSSARSGSARPWCWCSSPAQRSWSARSVSRCGSASGSVAGSSGGAIDPRGPTEARREQARRRLPVRHGGRDDHGRAPSVVAPVPEDPALAMSIAYSFSGESSDPMRTTLESQVPTFENHEGMPTVIDPVSEQVEQAEQVEQGDFEMKTREMTAVDLEALGLSDAGTSGNNLPIQRLSSPTADSLAGAESSGLAVRFRKRDATDPVDDVDVEL